MYCKVFFSTSRMRDCAMSYYKINTILSNLINDAFKTSEVSDHFNLCYLITQSSFLSSKEVTLSDYLLYHKSSIYLARMLRHFENESSYDYYFQALNIFMDTSSLKCINQFNRKDLLLKTKEISSGILLLLEHINKDEEFDSSFCPNGMFNYVVDILDEIAGYLSEKKTNSISIILYELAFQLLKCKESYKEKALEFLLKQMILYGEKSIFYIDLEINSYEISRENKFIASAIQRSIKVLDHMRIKKCIKLIQENGCSNDMTLEIYKLLGIAIVDCNDECLEQAKVLIRVHERENKKLLSLVNQEVSTWLR